MKSSGRISKDLAAGVLFIAVGAAFLWIGWGYRFGTSRQMGPGYFPVVLSVMLIGLGMLVTLRGLAQTAERVDGLNPKGILFISGATLAFALLVRAAGMPIAIFVLAFVGAMASSRFRPASALLLAGGLTAFCVLAFNFALGMPFPIWGYWFR